MVQSASFRLLSKENTVSLTFDNGLISGDFFYRFRSYQKSSQSTKAAKVKQNRRFCSMEGNPADAEDIVEIFVDAKQWRWSQNLKSMQFTSVYIRVYKLKVAKLLEDLGFGDWIGESVNQSSLKGSLSAAGDCRESFRCEVVEDFEKCFGGWFFWDFSDGPGPATDANLGEACDTGVTSGRLFQTSWLSPFLGGRDEIAYSDCLVSPPDVSNVFLMHFQHFPVGFLLLAVIPWRQTGRCWRCWAPTSFDGKCHLTGGHITFTTQTLHSVFTTQKQIGVFLNLSFDVVSFVVFWEPRAAKSHGAIWVGSSERKDVWPSPHIKVMTTAITNEESKQGSTDLIIMSKPIWGGFGCFLFFFGWFPALLRPFLPAGLLNSGCLSSLSKCLTSLDIKLIGWSHSGIHAFGMLWCRRGEATLEFDHSNHLNHLKFQQFQREALFFATPIFRGALFQLDLAGDKTFWCVVWSIRSSPLQIDSYLDVFWCFWVPRWWWPIQC